MELISFVRLLFCRFSRVAPGPGFLKIVLAVFLLGSAAAAAEVDTGRPAIPDGSQPMVIGAESFHRVAAGETLSSIARRHGVPAAFLMRANHIENPDLIRIARLLIVPSRMILPAAPENGLVVNLPEYRLFFFRAGKLLAIYPVGIGRTDWQTPLGAFKVTSRVRNPSWRMTENIARRENNGYREIVPPGPDNPLGDYWVGTSIESTGLHGTNQPGSIGLAMSHGCVRLAPGQVGFFFSQVRIGDPGEFIYEPVKAAAWGGRILIEAHPDVYGLCPDFEARARARLEGLGLWERVDPERLRRVLAERRGVPTPVEKR